MSQNHPALQVSTRESRPGTATAGAVIAVVITGFLLFSLVFGAIMLIVVRNAAGPAGSSSFLGRQSNGDDTTGAVAGLLVMALIVGVGLTAGIKTLRNSNGWRIATVVFGFLTTAGCVIGVIAVWASHQTCTDTYDPSTCTDTTSGRVPATIGLTVWGVLAAASAILLLVNGARAFYTGPTPSPVGTGTTVALTQHPQLDTTGAVTPVGWYPLAGALRWWNGTVWTEHVRAVGNTPMQAPTERRPAEPPWVAVRAANIAIIATLVITVIDLGLIVGQNLPDTGIPGVTAVVRMFLIISAIMYVAIAVVSVVAGFRTRQGSNGWRVTLIVLGWLTVAHGVNLAFTGAFGPTHIPRYNGDGTYTDIHVDRHPWFVVLGITMIAVGAYCSVTLARKPVSQWYVPKEPVIGHPGWYLGPSDHGQWWTGHAWAETPPPPPVA
jgi:hypothetical protein